MIADVKVGLVLVDDAFAFINPAIEFIHDEILVKVSSCFFSQGKKNAFHIQFGFFLTFVISLKTVSIIYY